MLHDNIIEEFRLLCWPRQRLLTETLHSGGQLGRKESSQYKKGNNMQMRINQFVLNCMVFLVAAALVAGCASVKEKDVTLAQVSESARATINKETAGGHVDKITKEVERGKAVYDVEATVGGKHMEYLIADA